MRLQNLHLVLAIVGISGIVALFLPFTYDVSPMMGVIDEGFWPLSFPFFLSIAVSAASVRWITSGSFSKLESATAYIVSSATAGITLAWITDAFSAAGSEPSSIGMWLIVITPTVVLLLGTYLLVRELRRKGLQGFCPVLALQIAYLGNAVFCLLAFANDLGWQAGAYLSLVTAVAYLIQIGLAYSQSRQSPAPG